MSAAEDVVHTKAILFEDLQTKLFRDLMAGWMESEAREALEWRATAAFQHPLDENAECDYMAQVVEASENFYVSPQMIRLAAEVAPEMPDEELLPHDLPSDAGFMWLGEPYSQLDVRRKVMSTNCFMWHASGSKVRMWHFTHKSNMNDWVNQWAQVNYEEEFRRMLPMLSVNHVFEMEFGQKLPRGLSWDTPLPFDARVEWQKTVTPEGEFAMQMWTDQPIEEMAKGGPPREIRSPLSAFIVCLWRLCQQSIASRYDEYPNRTSRRRLLRANLPTKPISIITLRKFDQERAHPEAGVEWQHHWVVRKHWRRQPYREKNSDGEKVTIYRWILIHPYLKGDLDKPLLHREKVNQLIR